MSNSVFQSVGIMYRTYLSYANDFLKDKDISFSESVILSNVGLFEGISQEEISVSLYIDRAAIARSVKTLEEKGYLEYKRDLVDKRVKRLYLTKKGWEAYEFIATNNKSLLKNLYEGLSQNEIEKFQETLNMIENRIPESKMKRS